MYRMGLRPHTATTLLVYLLLLPFLILRLTVSHDIQELNKLSRSSSYYRPINSYSSSTASAATSSSTSATPSTTTILSTSSSNPSSPMRSDCNNSTTSRNGIYTARDLIREFMAKNASPPAILKPSYQPFEYSKDLDIAYRHPQLLRAAGRKMEPESDVASSSSSSIYNNRHERLVEGRIDARPPFADSNANAVPNPSPTVRHRSNFKRNISDESDCKLVGHVAKNIVKTWEQINSNPNPPVPVCAVTTGKRDLVLARQVSSTSEESEPMIYYQPVDENKASFHVNKVIYSEEEDVSDNFFDSIDNANNDDDSEENIVSISHDDAGEGLIGVDSYERIKHKWSLDSDVKIDKIY